MQQKTQQEELIESYLFGRLNEQERTEFEERFFADGESFEQLLAVESALIDRYARGELPEYARERVERLLLSSPIQQRELEFTHKLIDLIPKAIQQEIKRKQTVPAKAAYRWQKVAPGRPQFPFIAALLVACFFLLGLNVYLLSQNRDLQNQVTQEEASRIALEQYRQEATQQLAEESEGAKKLSKELEDERNRRAQVEQKLAMLRQSALSEGQPETALLALTQDPIVRRGGSRRPQVINVRPRTRWVKILIDLGKEEGYTRYDVKIQTVDGEPVWNSEAARSGKAGAKRLSLTVPTNVFHSDDFIAVVKGSNPRENAVDLYDFPFTVRRRRK